MNAVRLTVSSSPHCHCGARISDVYYNFLLALLPAAAMGVYYYGFDAVRVIGASIASAMISEALAQKILRRPVTIADGSAAASGMLLALILPAGVPLYVVVVANVMGIFVGKQLFGGLGTNPLNPALVGWAIVRVTKAWAGFLDFDLMLVSYTPGFPIQYPLAVLKARGAGGLGDVDYVALFLGQQTGGTGAPAILCLLIGGGYLAIRGFIRWQIALSYLLGVAGVSGIFWLTDSATFANPLFHLLTGNVAIAAFFLLTDSASSPISRWGMVVFGLVCGTLTVVLRAWSVYPDGVVFAGLLTSLFVPLFDKLRTRPRTQGTTS